MELGVSLLVGFVATGVALVIGVSWGIIAGYAGGRVDSIMMRIVDVLIWLTFHYFRYFINGNLWQESLVALWSNRSS